MITEQQIKKLVEEKTSGTEIFPVEITVKPGNKINVLIDSDKGVAISDCVNVSRHIEGNLNREIEDFELQVSSSGIDQPLRITRQYKKYIGKQVQVITKAGDKITGELLNANDEGIEVEERKKEKVEGKKSKQLIVNKHNLNFNQIKETRIVISF